MSDCCLMPTIIFVSHIMARTSYISMGCWWWCLLCTRQISLVGSWIALNHWNNIPQVDVWLLFVTLQWVRLNQSLLCKYQFYCRWCVPIGQELSISGTRGKHSLSITPMRHIPLTDHTRTSLTTEVAGSNPAHSVVYSIQHCDKVFLWLAVGWWFSLGTPVSSTNKTDVYNITEILLKVALNTINLSLFHLFTYSPMFRLVICSRGDYCWNTV